MRVMRLAVLLMLLPLGAFAQSFSDALDEALSHWRAAVWYSRTGNSGVASLEVLEFATQWRLLAEKTRGAPPPPSYGRCAVERVSRSGERAG